MDVIRSRNTSSGSEVEAVTYAVKSFYTDCSELILYSDFRSACGTQAQPTVVAVPSCGSTVRDVGCVPASEETCC